jgi:hypothetical protein
MGALLGVLMFSGLLNSVHGCLGNNSPYCDAKKEVIKFSNFFF